MTDWVALSASHHPNCSPENEVINGGCAVPPTLVTVTFMIPSAYSSPGAEVMELLGSPSATQGVR